MLRDLLYFLAPVGSQASPRFQAPSCTQASLRFLASPRFFVGLGSLALLFASGCAHSVPPAEVATASGQLSPQATEEPPQLLGEGAREHGAKYTVGDFWVRQFGAPKGALLQLREEVVAHRPGLVVFEYTLTKYESDDSREVLQQLRTEVALQSGKLLRVERLVEGSYVPASVADYEALFAPTQFPLTRNLGKIAESDDLCLVGAMEVPCKKTSYSVQLDGEQAELIVARSHEQDLNGEVRALDGTLLYHSELVEMRSQRSIAPVEKEASLAQSDFERRD